MKNERTKTKIIITKSMIYHAICITLVVISVVFMLFRFRPQFLRLWQGIKDLALSFVFYITELIRPGCGLITPTVSEIPDNMSFEFPFTWEEFKPLLEKYFKLLLDERNFRKFSIVALTKTANFLSNVMLLIIPCFTLVFSLYVIYTTPNSKQNEDTKALTAFKRFEKRVIEPPKRAILAFFAWFKQSIYAKILAGIWAFNLSVIVIILEVFAWVFYFSASFDVINLYVQILKFAMDMQAPVNFLPWWCWLLIGLFVFGKIRYAMGLKILRAHEETNKRFLETHPGALFVVGKQRSKKTTIITSLALTQGVIFREKARDKLSDRDKQFPNFPWFDLEKFFKQAFDRHLIFTLAGCRNFIRLLRDLNAGVYDKSMTNSIKKHLLRKKYGYYYDNFCFGYDMAQFPTKYNDKLRIIDIYEAIENYLQEYFIYSSPTSLLFSNYAIREDFRWEDYGNFPKFKGDFFEIEPEEAEKNTQYSHIFDMDSGRMLKKMDENNPNKDGFEVGCLNETEYAKERGNQHTNAGRRANDQTVNAKNDGHENDLKMRGHAATIDNYTFFRLLIDDQRADSLMAENRDLCDIVQIKKTAEANIVLPFFAFEEAFDIILTKIYDKVYYSLRNLRGDNTLLVYLMKKIYTPLHNHYVRNANMFSECISSVKVWDAMDDELLEEKGKLYISFKKVYSGRFATDSLKGYYHEKASNSAVGLNDFEPFTGLEMTTEQMKKTNSLFYKAFLEILEKEKNSRRKWRK